MHAASKWCLLSNLPRFVEIKLIQYKVGDMQVASFPSILGINFYKFEQFLLCFGVVAQVKNFTDLQNVLAKYLTQVAALTVNVNLLFSAYVKFLSAVNGRKNNKLFQNHCTTLFYNATRWCNFLNTHVLCALLSLITLCYNIILIMFLITFNIKTY